MNIKNSEFKLILEIPEEKITIQDLDIDYIIVKTTGKEPDIAHINIWNLEESIYANLIENNSKIYIYTEYNNNERNLLFNGYIDSKHIIRTPIITSKYITNDIPTDILTNLKIINTKKQLENSFINIDYRGEIPAQKIIDDCIQAMGLGKIIINSNLPNKLYPTFKAKGKPNRILDSICSSLEIPYLIKNEIVYLGYPNSDTETPKIVTLSEENSKILLYKNENKIKIITKLTPELEPYDYVLCNFTDLEGYCCVSGIYSNGNNYDTAGITEIIIKPD